MQLASLVGWQHERSGVPCRARHERERNRTRERALLSLQQVVEATEQHLPAPAHRMRCAR